MHANSIDPALYFMGNNWAQDRGCSDGALCFKGVIVAMHYSVINNFCIIIQYSSVNNKLHELLHAI